MKTSKHCLSRKCMLSLAPQRLINIEVSNRDYGYGNVNFAFIHFIPRYVQLRL